MNHILLSLLLLVSQQMAFAHAISHWTGMRGAVNPAALQAGGIDGSDLTSALAQDQSCRQCLVFAQMAGAIGSTPRQFVPLDLRAERVSCRIGAGLALRVVPLYQSRAPPRFV